MSSDQTFFSLYVFSCCTLKMKQLGVRLCLWRLLRWKSILGNVILWLRSPKRDREATLYKQIYFHFFTSVQKWEAHTKLAFCGGHLTPHISFHSESSECDTKLEIKWNKLLDKFEPDREQADLASSKRQYSLFRPNIKSHTELWCWTFH